MAAPAWLDAFLRRHRLPAEFRSDAEAHLDRVAGALDAGRFGTTGLSGAQGTGKSTMGDYLVEAHINRHGKRALLLSLDDFYLPQRARKDLATRIHPLLATRGVPGTHDLDLLNATLDALAVPGAAVALPVFDKASDDRLPRSAWRNVLPPFDQVLLEGWCIGAGAETAATLKTPVNALERDQDPAGTWRSFVNEQLAGTYAALNARLDALVYLEAPDWSSVLRWRQQQERELLADHGHGMTADEVTDFVQYFERITRNGLRELPSIADILVRLDDAHRIRGVHVNRDESPGS